MENGYLSRSWTALTSDKGWWKPICILAVVQLIPILGQIVCLGYIYQWGREAAWGIEKPFTHKVGRLGHYLRCGGILFLINLCWGILLSIVSSLISRIPIIGGFLGVVCWFAILIAEVLLLVMMMRATIYDSFEPGIQVTQVFDMAKRDAGGLVRIFCISLLSLLSVIVVVLAVVPAFLVGFGVTLVSLRSVLLPITIVIAVIIGFLALVLCTVVSALVIRAVGYWTAQFEPAKWGSSKAGIPAGVGPAPKQQATPAAQTASQTQAQPQPQAQAQPQPQPASQTAEQPPAAEQAAPVEQPAATEEVPAAQPAAESEPGAEPAGAEQPPVTEEAPAAKEPHAAIPMPAVSEEKAVDEGSTDDVATTEKKD